MNKESDRRARYIFILLFAAATAQGADSNAKLISRVEKHAEGLRDRALPDGKLVRAHLKLPHEVVTFLIWLPPPKKDVLKTSAQGNLSRDAIRKAQREAAKATELSWPKDLNAAEFGKWATGFLSFKRAAFVSHFDSELEAEYFEQTWLAGISRNATNLRVIRSGEMVIWGSADLLERF